MVDRNRIIKASAKVAGSLMSAREEVSWEGHLSSSALATAVACFALSRRSRKDYSSEIKRSLQWLAENQNRDGGWGDTPESRSNISTTLLVLAAYEDSDGGSFARHRALARSWIKGVAGEFQPLSIASAVKKRYGNDLTFSTPILSVCALSGILGDEERAWPLVPQLPFDLLFLPSSLYRRGLLRVVSYGLPALIALGVLHHIRHRARGILRAKARDVLIPRALSRLDRMQPVSGGFLEAQPLTGFVVGSLCAAGYSSLPVVSRGCRFLRDTQRPDGSWPIDVNLSTWLTSLSSSALTSGEEQDHLLSSGQKDKIVRWLLDARIAEPDPMTGAEGGWGWTDLPGRVPDADDTSAAMIALSDLGAEGAEVEHAVRAASSWLISLQNRDGGVPTFCRGWSGLHFDRSCPDITAHAIHSLFVWSKVSGVANKRFIARAARYLRETQKGDGSWEPLWFGNESVPGMSNPVFGTGRVLSELSNVTALHSELGPSIAAGRDFLVRMQNNDGGWGGSAGAPSTVEETSAALAALAESDNCKAINRGLAWLSDTILEADGAPDPAPIGLYFASLWYAESLYPLIFAVKSFRVLNAVDTQG